MKYVVVCVRDRCADVFSVPNFVPNVQMAVRSFTDQVNKPDSSNMLYSHSEDFDLFELGIYDDSDGSVEWLKAPRQVVLGKDVKRREDGHG